MKTLIKHQKCGCIVCTCEDEKQCHGCGAKHCGTHVLGEIPNPIYYIELDPIENGLKLLETAEDVLEYLKTGKVHGVGYDDVQVIECLEKAINDTGNRQFKNIDHG